MRKRGQAHDKSKQSLHPVLKCNVLHEIEHLFRDPRHLYCLFSANPRSSLTNIQGLSLLMKLPKTHLQYFKRFLEGVYISASCRLQYEELA